MSLRTASFFCLGGSGNAGSNVSFNSKFVQQELQRLDGVLADLVETEQTLSKISSAEHRESLMIAIQAVSKQLCTSDILANLAETLEMHSRLAEEQNKVHLKRGEKQALVWVAEAEMNSHKTRLEHAKEHRQRTKSSGTAISGAWVDVFCLVAFSRRLRIAGCIFSQMMQAASMPRRRSWNSCKRGKTSPGRTSCAATRSGSCSWRSSWRSAVP